MLSIENNKVLKWPNNINVANGCFMQIIKLSLAIIRFQVLMHTIHIKCSKLVFLQHDKIIISGITKP